MATYLLDSHALLWATSSPAKLSARARKLINNDANRILVSHATIWDLSIKVTIGKLKLPESFFESLPTLGYEWLPLTTDHFARYRQLPLHHRDPFDRLLVAQANVEDHPLISMDPEIRHYEVVMIW